MALGLYGRFVRPEVLHYYSKLQSRLNINIGCLSVPISTQKVGYDENDWDIVISGGGLVGSAMACALGYAKMLSQKKILLLETGPRLKFSSLTNRYSNRVFALTPGTKALMKSFGAWDIISNLRLKEVKKMQVWENCSDASIAFQHSGLQSDIAYIVENEVILQALAERMENLKLKLVVYNNAKVVKYDLPKLNNVAHWADDWVSITLEDGRQLRTKLLIGADGANSLVRKSMNVKYIKWNYQQNAIVATLKLSEPYENNIAWQRFLPTGPIALLPLTDSLSSLVWVVTPSMATKLMKMSNEEFVDELNDGLWDDTKKNPSVESVLSSVSNLLKTFFPAKGSIKQLPPSIMDIDENSRAAFPLSLGHTTEYVSSRIALIGDAAHKIHPMAGQGLNLGFGDVHCLQKVLSKCVSIGGDIGDLSTLLEYEKLRQRHVIPTMATIEGLHRLYSTDLSLLVLLRSVGLIVTDSLPSVKERIIAYASS